MRLSSRVIKSLTRQKGKSLLLLLLLFILTTVMALALSYTQAADQVKADIAANIGTVVRLSHNPDRFGGKNDPVDPHLHTTYRGIDPELAETLGSSPYVAYYTYDLDTNCGVAEGFTPYYPDTENLSENDAQTVKWHKEDPFFVALEISVNGISNENVDEYNYNRWKLVSGRSISQEDIKENRAVAVISDKLAEANNIKLGDTFNFACYVEDWEAMDASGKNRTIIYKDPVSVPLTVVGFFKDIYTQTLEGEMSDIIKVEEEIRQNNSILVPIGVAKDLITLHINEGAYDYASNDHPELDTSENFTRSLPIFFLKSAEMKEAFIEENTPLINQDYFVFATSMDNYEQVAAPVENLKSLSQKIFRLAAVASITLMSLLLLLFLRDRRQEMGILLTFGLSRKKILLQLACEVLVIALIAITLGLFVGHSMAKSFSQDFIEGQKVKADEDMTFTTNISYNPEITQDLVLVRYKIGLSPGFILQVYLWSFITLALSLGINALFVLRLNPKKILMTSH